jgi:hypothetical protein
MLVHDDGLQNMLHWISMKLLLAQGEAERISLDVPLRQSYASVACLEATCGVS